TQDEQVLQEMQSALQRLGVTRHIVRRFESYEIRAEIGRGGFATVYAAVDPRMGRDVALKVYHAGISDNVRSMHQRMLLEVRSLASVFHPALVRIFDSGVAGERLFVVMELVEGNSLQQLQRTLVEEFNSTSGDMNRAHSVLPRLA